MTNCIFIIKWSYHYCNTLPTMAKLFQESQSSIHFTLYNFYRNTVGSLKFADFVNPIKAGLFFAFYVRGGGGGGRGRFDLTLWQLITFKPLTIAIPYLLR